MQSYGPGGPAMQPHFGQSPPPSGPVPTGGPLPTGGGALPGRLSADPLIPVWYPAENNWQACLAKMNNRYREIMSEFSGEWSEEQKVLAETKGEKAKDFMFEHTGGHLGNHYETHTRTAKVVDIFQDWNFPGDDRSWFRGGVAKDNHDFPAPARWQRLQEYSLDVPYPTPDAAAGMFNPRAGRVYQGQMEDFYLIAGMQAVGMKPVLIQNVFANMQFSSPKLGVFMLRLHKHGQWQYVDIDDAMPFDKEYNPLFATSEFFPDLSWPALIEKAYAKLHGSWEGLGGGGHIEEVMTDLTGGCSSRYGTTDVAADRLWQYLFEMQKTCIFACNINESECAKRNVPIEKHWASSIFRIAKHEGVPYVCVCTAAPAATVRHLPVCDVPSPEGYGIQDGFAWLRIDDFIAFFDTIYECRLYNSDLGPPQLTGIPYSPGYWPPTGAGMPWYEEMWAFQGMVYSETSPSFLIEVMDAPCEITLEVSQTDMRYSDPHEEPENGRRMQAPLLLRFYQCSREVSDEGGGELYLVHLSAWGHSRDACCGVKVMRPGKFLAMVSLPVKYVCDKMIFRTYSTKPIAMKPVTQHRSWLPVNPAMPLDAIPYSLAGFMRVDAYSERLPQMFDEAEGRGKKMANSQTRPQQAASGWQKGVQGTFEKAFGKKHDTEGLKVVGKFGGKDAHATVEATEVQDGCQIA
mmetsp:Transcript_53461/g.141013  ORF Transcript_53461/g.141013 Transcript_53461/m.141013 type:complete len:687 (+) Transcript_53461:2-2062(+)